MSRPFELTAEYKPAGDQGQAIEALCDGIGAGLAHQTLLGVTGSGKSVGYDDTVFVLELRNGISVPRVGPIGELVDSLCEDESVLLRNNGDTQILVPPSTRQFFTFSFDPSSGSTGWHKVTEFTRHLAPSMHRVRTACGRKVLLTGDHALFVLRNGELKLRKTADTQPGDYVPVPSGLDYETHLPRFDIKAYLRDNDPNHCMSLTNFIRAQQQSATVRPQSTAAMDVHGSNPAFIWPTKARGETTQTAWGQHLAHESTETHNAYETSIQSTVESNDACASPSSIALSDCFLRLIGYYIAGGNGTERYFTVPRWNPVTANQLKRSLDELGLPSPALFDGAYRIDSPPLAELLGNLCGKKASEKRLPPFWPSLCIKQLSVLLRAYFDGVGRVTKTGRILAHLCNSKLSCELAYALLRFGISVNLPEKCPSLHHGRRNQSLYEGLSIAGSEDLGRFLSSIDFDFQSKHLKLQHIVRRGRSTTADVVPINAAHLRKLRHDLGISLKDLAEQAGVCLSTLALIENAEIYPPRRVLQAILEVLQSLLHSDDIAPLCWHKTWRSMARLCHVRWRKITTCSNAAYSHPYVYDLSVPGPETFLAGAGGIFVHNTFSIANVIQTHQRPTLVLAPNKTLAAQLYGEMREFFPNNAVEYFVSYYDYYQPEAYVPTTDTYIEKDASINEHIEQMRLSATKSLLERPDSIIVATVSAIYGLGDPESFHAMVLHLARGDVIDQRKILRRLAELQYKRNDVELHRGNYRVRGEIIDIYPAESEREAVRVELFDEEIESLSFFDPLTGEVLRRVPRLTIYPKSHYVTERQVVLDAIEAIKIELVERLDQLRSVNKLVEAQRLEQRTRFDIEMMQELGHCKGIENYSRFLSGRNPGEAPPTLFDYLPPEALLVIDESHVTVPQLGGMYRGDRSRKETLVEYGFRLPSALDNRPLRFDEFENLAPQTIFVSATPGPYEQTHSDEIVEQVVRPTGLVDPEIAIKPASTQVDDLMSEIDRRVALSERVLVTTLTKRMAEDLTDYLSEHGVRVRYLHSDVDTVERVEIIRDLRLGEFDVLVGINLLREGLDMPEVSLVAILDADKEGFLRSDRSLIQTVGRAARNINGTAILYADTITGSMRRALDETNRRREKQIEHNRANDITPQGIRKAIADVMEGASGLSPSRPRRKSRLTEEKGKYASMGPDKLAKTIRTLEQRMYKHADNLEFEEAANLRDQIAEIREVGFGLPRLNAGGRQD